MLKDITTIKIMGANFTTPTDLKYFDPTDGKSVKTVKGALLYGRNGTGKSTTARAFRKVASGEKSIITSASLYDNQGGLISLSEEEKRHIFIFDEEYVDKNVRLQQDHLDTIVMLGQAADLSDKISQAQTEYESAKESLESQDVIIKEYQDMGNIKSPQYHLMKISNALRGDDSWAGRDRTINNGRQNTGVRDDTYKRFIGLTPSRTRTELLEDYRIKLLELNAARSGASTITTKVPGIPSDVMKYNDEDVNTLLSAQIEKPILSEREKKLLALVQSSRANDLSERMRIFKSPDVQECPYCYQSLSQEYKQSLVESIEKVLSKIVEDHQKDLKKLIISELVIDLTPFVKLQNYESCKQLVEKINESIQKYISLLNQKIDNPYEAIEVEIGTISAMALQLKEELEKLETERIEYNKASQRTQPIIKELNRINSEIAYYDVIMLVQEYDKQQKEYTDAQTVRDSLKKNHDEKKKQLDDLEAQRKNIRLALDAINACLKYIFFTDNRLQIDYVDGEYKLLSHGKSVKPCDVSVGERNIIGLSYFFTSILEGKEEEKAYGEEYLIVIDDPISSYDTENKIGILSFLKYKLGVFLEGNVNTKALVMTHDLMTFYDMHKIFEEIVSSCKQKGYPVAPKFNRFEIKDGVLQTFAYSGRQEYTELIKNVYSYALGEADSYEIVIGNMMRQMLEAFSTFQYKKGIEDISTDANILGLLPEKEYIAYYKNLMYRLVLHGGSHREEQIKTMQDFNFFSLISEVEKKRTAKDIICFIYLLNGRHVMEHLKGCKNVEANLKTWCNEIKSRAAII